MAKVSQLVAVQLLLLSCLSKAECADGRGEGQLCLDEDSSQDFDAEVLLQTNAHHKQHSTQGTTLPHDENFNECDNTKVAPERVGIWDGRFDAVPQAKVIMDIGGNVGSDVELLRTKHPQARIYTFEPVPALFEGLKSKFAKDPNVVVTNVGVSDTTGETEFIVEGAIGEGATAVDHTTSGKHIKVHLQDVDTVLAFIQKETGQAPDLLNMNCEGCEYGVMTRMREKGWIPKVANLQLSWHLAGDVTDRVEKRCDVEKMLWQSHIRSWRSDFGWVGWKPAP